MITLLVNEKKQLVDPPVTVKQYLLQSGLQHEKGVAVAVNDLVVPKTRWPIHSLNDKDKVTIITATAGG